MSFARGIPIGTPSTSRLSGIVSSPHDEVNSIIEDFESKWKCGLEPRPLSFSPSKRKRTIAEMCVGNIKYLFHQNRLKLDDVLLKFWRLEEERTRESMEVSELSQERCRVLLRLLRDASNEVQRTPRSEWRRNRKQETPSNKILLSAGNSFGGDGFVKPITFSTGSLLSSKIVIDYDSGSPTDDDEDAEEQFETPPESPTMTTRASKGFLLGSRKQEVSPSRNRKKRSSEEGNVINHNNKKLQREDSGNHLVREAMLSGARLDNKVQDHPYRDPQPMTANTSFNTTTSSNDAEDQRILSSYGPVDEISILEAEEKIKEPLQQPLQHLDLSGNSYSQDFAKSQDIIEAERRTLRQHCRPSFVARLEIFRSSNILGHDFDLAKSWSPEYNSYEAFWRWIGGESRVNPSRVSKAAWTRESTGYLGCTLKASIKGDNFGQLAKGINDLTFECLHESKSNRFQRKFGAHRLLYVTVEDVFLKEHSGWLLSSEHELLDCKWRAFFMEQVKKPARRNETKGSPEHRIVFFAMSGLYIPDEEELTLTELIRWFMPIEKLLDEPFCKIFARLSLGLSKTTAALTFQYSEIRLVKDTLADDGAEDNRFNDPMLLWENTFDKKMVMNDGCSQISRGAAKLISKSLGLHCVPSAFQARIGGAKGVWSVCEDDDDVWIEITESQLKFPFHSADATAEYDKHRLTFEVLRWSGFPGQYSLHFSFLAILEERGVPREHIALLFRNHLDSTDEELKELANDPVSWYQWIFDHFVWENFNRAADGGKPMLQLGSLPALNYETALRLLAAEFTPHQEEFLAKKIQSLVRSQLLKESCNLSIPLAKSVNILGIADPCSVLKSGQVHLVFSKYLTDEDTGMLYNSPHGKNALITRHPAMRRSDIQKVTIVNHPSLRHLVDVAVFPTRGCFPLAGKLQGGDYDGDTFVIYWDELLTRSFQNAPLPTTSPDLDVFGVKARRETVGEIVPRNPLTVDKFLTESFDFVRKQSGLLGTVTNMHETVCANEGRIVSGRIEKFNELHDILIDALKNGYIYDKNRYDEFRDTCLSSKQKRYGEPAWKRESKRVAEDMKDGVEKTSPFDKVRIPGDMGYINDYLYFRVLIPNIEKNLNSLAKRFKQGDPMDQNEGDLGKVMCEALKLENKYDKEIIKNLESDIKKLTETWKTKNGERKNAKNQRTAEGRVTFDSIIATCYGEYQSIKPRVADSSDTVASSIMEKWTFCVAEGQISSWSYLKASCLYRLASSAMKFYIAGDILIPMKAGQAPSKCAVSTERIRSHLKPRRRRIPQPTVDTEDDPADAVEGENYQDALSSSYKRSRKF